MQKIHIGCEMICQKALSIKEMYFCMRLALPLNIILLLHLSLYKY